MTLYANTVRSFTHNFKTKINSIFKAFAARRHVALHLASACVHENCCCVTSIRWQTIERNSTREHTDRRPQIVSAERCNIIGSVHGAICVWQPLRRSTCALRQRAFVSDVQSQQKKKKRNFATSTSTRHRTSAVFFVSFFTASTATGDLGCAAK